MEKENTAEPKIDVLACSPVVVDEVHITPEPPQAGKPVFVTSISKFVGGHAANFAVDLVRLGVDPKRIGVTACIGTDENGQFFEAELTKHGIQLFLEKVGGSTGRDTIVVPRRQDRMFLISVGVNLLQNPDKVRNLLITLKPRFFSVRAGYSNVAPHLSSVLKGFKEEGMFILLDLMHPYRDKWRHEVLRSLRLANAVHCNASEANAITGASSARDSAFSFLNRGADMVLMTHGELGAWLVTKKHGIIREPAYDVPIRDPSGCGDAACAALIATLLDMDTPNVAHLLSKEYHRELLSRVQAAGAAVGRGVGCTPPTLTPKRVWWLSKKGKKREEVFKEVDEVAE